MAFINEKIPEDFLKSFDFDVFKGFGGSPAKISGYWCRDKDRDAFLIATDAGGGPHVGSQRQVKFGFYWKGDVVYFWGDEVETQDEKGWITTWENTHLSIASYLEPRRAEFVTLLKEALTARNARISKNPDYNNRVIVNLV